MPSLRLPDPSAAHTQATSHDASPIQAISAQVKAFVQVAVQVARAAPEARSAMAAEAAVKAKALLQGVERAFPRPEQQTSEFGHALRHLFTGMHQGISSSAAVSMVLTPEAKRKLFALVVQADTRALRALGDAVRRSDTPTDVLENAQYRAESIGERALDSATAQAAAALARQVGARAQARNPSSDLLSPASASRSTGAQQGARGPAPGSATSSASQYSANSGSTYRSSYAPSLPSLSQSSGSLSQTLSTLSFSVPGRRRSMGDIPPMNEAAARAAGHGGPAGPGHVQRVGAVAGPAAARARAAAANPIEIIQGSKSKIDVHYLSHLFLEPGIRYSRLEGAAPNTSGVMASTFMKGGYGKVRLFFPDASKDGVSLPDVRVVKEMRLERKHAVIDQPPGYGLADKKVWGPVRATPGRTLEDKLSNVLGEVKETMRLRPLIEEAMAICDSPDAGPADSLRAVRKGVVPFEIFEVNHVPRLNKVFVVMTRELGDVNNLLSHVPAALRPDVAMSVAAQGFTELAAMHGAGGTAHLDLKAGNMLVAATGQIKISDYGLIAPLDSRGRVAISGAHGTLLAPEMLPQDRERPNRLGVLGAYTDVWSMAATVVRVASGRGTPDPFLWPKPEMPKLPQDPGLRDAVVHAYEAGIIQRAHARMDEFESFRAGLKRADGRGYDASKIKPEGLFGTFFAPLAQAQPALCELLLEHAFSRAPQRRLPAAKLGELIRTELNTRGKVNMAGIMQAVSDLEGNAQLGLYQDQADVYRDFAANF